MHGENALIYAECVRVASEIRSGRLLVSRLLVVGYRDFYYMYMKNNVAVSANNVVLSSRALYKTLKK